MPQAIRQISAPELKTMLDQGVPLELFDVRTDAERAIAHVEGARPLDDEGMAYLQGLPRDTLLVFMCHHGVRSQSAARHFQAQGFSNVGNVVGGIEAWSLSVDPAVPRY